MDIDLRTGAEKARHPHPSDVEVEVSVPPLGHDEYRWMKSTLLNIAGSRPRETFRVFCAKGNRSRMAAEILREAGYSVVDLGGVM